MSALPIGSHEGYPRRTYEIPPSVARAAADGLALRARYGRGGTTVGLARARQLASGRPAVTLRDLVHMRAYFRRHAVDNLDEQNPPSNGWVAWQLWGGYAAQRWAERVVNAYRREKR